MLTLIQTLPTHLFHYKPTICMIKMKPLPLCLEQKLTAEMPKRSISNDEDEASMINFSVVDQVEHKTYFKVRHDTRMGKVFRSYYKRRNTKHTIEFLYEGNRISHLGHKTPAELGIEDGGEISAMETMMGG